MTTSTSKTTPFSVEVHYNAFSSMALTEQQTPARRMLAFENVVFKNEPSSDQTNVTPSVQLPIKAQRVTSTNVFVRLSQRFSSSRIPKQQSNIFPTSPPASSSTLERQNSSESDLSLSKLDLANEYSVVDGQDSLNTSRQTSELNLAESNSTTSHVNTSQRFARSFRTFFSRIQIIEKKNSSSSTTNLCCCCCFSTRTDSSDVPISPHQRFFT